MKDLFITRPYQRTPQRLQAVEGRQLRYMAAQSACRRLRPRGVRATLANPIKPSLFPSSFSARIPPRAALYASPSV